MGEKVSLNKSIGKKDCVVSDLHTLFSTVSTLLMYDALPDDCFNGAFLQECSYNLLFTLIYTKFYF